MFVHIPFNSSFATTARIHSIEFARRQGGEDVCLCIKAEPELAELDGLSSRLPFEVVERRGLAYALHAGIDTFADAGMTVIDGACAPRKLPHVVEEVLRVLGDLAEKPVPEEELARVQRRHRMTLAFSLDSVSDLAGWYGAGEVLSSPEGFEERCRRVEQVTAADVQRVARETFRRRNLVAVVVGPARKRERAAVERVVRRSGAIPE